MSHDDLYDFTYYRRSKKFQIKTARMEELVNIVLSYFPNKVLDVGCGLGTLVKKLQMKGLYAIGVDKSIVLKEKFGMKEPWFIETDATKLPFADKSFDLVISTDFFEHIPTEDIDKVYSEMKRVGEKVIARIAFKAPLTERQKQYHCTNKTKEWWINKLPGIILI